MTGILTGKVALVTGAGSGIGLAAAKAFADAGASVVLADRDEEALGKGTEGIRSTGHNAIGVTCDVTDNVQVAAMIGQAITMYGRLDAAFNNAGINSDSALLLDTSDDEFDRVISVNLRGVWNCMKAELRHMLVRGSGAIVNCSSIGGMVGSRGRSAYSASKHGVIGLTRSAALEYAAQGIRINAVCPGMVNTPMAVAVTKNYDPEIVKAMVAREPIGRFGEPEEIAAAVVWLCTPAASFMVDHAIAVDGGLLAVMPWREFSGPTSGRGRGSRAKRPSLMRTGALAAARSAPRPESRRPGTVATGARCSRRRRRCSAARPRGGGSADSRVTRRPS